MAATSAMAVNKMIVDLAGGESLQILGSASVKVDGLAATSLPGAVQGAGGEVKREGLMAKMATAKEDAAVPKGAATAKGATGTKAVTVGAPAKVMTLNAPPPGTEIKILAGKGGAVLKGATGKAVAAQLATGSAAAVPGGAKAIAVGGTIWSGKGLSLGLGLGPWGPVALGVIGLMAAGAIYGYVRKRRESDVQVDEELQEAIK